MGVKFTVTSNRDLAEAQLNKATAMWLEMAGTQAQNYAVLELETPKPHSDGSVRPNVDTGRLVNSISHMVKGDSAYIGTNVEYAAYVEMGTSRSKPYPYLKPAITKHTDEYKAMLEDCLRKA